MYVTGTTVHCGCAPPYECANKGKSASDI